MAARVIAIAFGAWVGDLAIAVILFSGASAICWLGLLFWVGHISGNSACNILKPSSEAFAVVLLCAIPVVIETNLAAENSLALWASIGMSLLMIVVCYWQLLHKVYR
jgi:hypothetical protein